MSEGGEDSAVRMVSGLFRGAGKEAVVAGGTTMLRLPFIPVHQYGAWVTSAWCKQYLYSNSPTAQFFKFLYCVIATQMYTIARIIFFFHLTVTNHKTITGRSSRQHCWPIHISCGFFKMWKNRTNKTSWIKNRETLLYGARASMSDGGFCSYKSFTETFDKWQG